MLKITGISELVRAINRQLGIKSKPEKEAVLQ
jgi:hypothetical protein